MQNKTQSEHSIRKMKETKAPELFDRPLLDNNLQASNFVAYQASESPSQEPTKPEITGKEMGDVKVLFTT